MIEHVSAVSLEGRRHFDRAIDLGLAAVGLWAKQSGEIVISAGRELQRLRTRQAPATVGHRRHLQRRLCAIEERVVYLAVQVIGRELFFGETLCKTQSVIFLPLPILLHGHLR